MAEFSPAPRVILSTQPDTVNSRKTAGPEVVVRLQSLDGTWETCGVDRAAGIFPENVTLSSDSWGPKTASFDLRRDPMLPWPDVLAFTPVKIEVDGQLVWSGRVSETPSREGAESVMSVTCEGWQAHLDDDLVDRMWVHDDLTAWKDFASLPTTPLGSGADNVSTAYRVIAGDGKLTLSVPNGAPMPQYTGVGAVLDLGPGRLAKRIVATWTATWVTANMRLYARGVPDGRFFGATDYADAFTPTLTTGPTTSTGNLGNGYRYVVLVAFYSGAAGTAGQDVNVSLSSIKVFGETAYESGNASALKASTVVAEAVTSAAPLLSSNTNTITTTALNLPEYAPEEPRTPREHINAVNGFHGWTTKVDAFRRMNYYAKPSRAKYDIGEYSLKEAVGSSGSTGAEIYNKVIVSGQDAGGNPVQVIRYSGDSLAGFVADADLTWTNPSFTDTDVSHWTVPGAGSFSRTTTAGEYVSSPAGGKLSGPTGQVSTAVITAVGTPVPFRVYRVSFKVRSSTSNAGMHASVGVGCGAEVAFVSKPSGTMPTSFTQYELYITPKTADPLGLNVEMYNLTGSGAAMMIDDITLESSQRTLPDRRDFLRAFQLSVNTMLPSDGVLAAAIGDAWLANHVTTTFKGDVTVSGADSVRDRLSGQPVPLYQLLADTDELLYFSDRIDPDTGAMGRTARITSVTYTPLDDKAVITLDNTRTDFETLLTRLGAT